MNTSKVLLSSSKNHVQHDVLHGGAEEEVDTYGSKTKLKTLSL